jgi:CheY-like chemotaxis protein
MPDADGVELIAALREARPDVPVVLLSGFVEPLGLTEKSTGASAVLAKSANEVQHLIRAINRLLKPAARRKPPATAEPPRARRKAVSSS